MSTLIESAPKHGDADALLPIVRLRVVYDSQIPMGNVARFGSEFAGRIANPKDALQLHLRRERAGSAASKGGSAARFDMNMMPAEKLERVSLESLVVENLRAQTLDMLNASELQRSVMRYIEKDERTAVEDFVSSSTHAIEDTLASDRHDESHIQAHLQRISERQRADGAASLQVRFRAAVTLMRQVGAPSADHSMPAPLSQDSMLGAAFDAQRSQSPPSQRSPSPLPQRRRRQGPAPSADDRPPSTPRSRVPPASTESSGPPSSRAAVLNLIGQSPRRSERARRS